MKQAAFPAHEKRLEALILYTTEIFLYLEENLKLTPQSMSDKVTAADELEEMHQQVTNSKFLFLIYEPVIFYHLSVYLFLSF